VNKATRSTLGQWEEHDDNARTDIDSGDESDGRSALRGVDAREGLRAARRGPGNASMQHFHVPMPIVDRLGKKCWEFRCRFCAWYVKNSIWSEQ